MILFIQYAFIFRRRGPRASVDSPRSGLGRWRTRACACACTRLTNGVAVVKGRKGVYLFRTSDSPRAGDELKIWWLTMECQLRIFKGISRGVATAVSAVSMIRAPGLQRPLKSAPKKGLTNCNIRRVLESYCWDQGRTGLEGPGWYYKFKGLPEAFDKDRLDVQF
ncbi:hypothetical protein EVAR_45330_1 [Eumeta japonica]|uniref:Uncharacterized protein n=1 Tax=Eumeta variegata TaxID=151549 RepID=A0A4C1XMR3_EUMVA|nr:hypothetical protein EVAR_45330_1 [Eumeta japonica]